MKQIIRSIGGLIVILKNLTFYNKSEAITTQLISPANFTIPITTINFDSSIDQSVANFLFSSQGIEFSRNDGLAIPITDLNNVNVFTTSNPNGIATISGIFEGEIVPT